MEASLKFRLPPAVFYTHEGLSNQCQPHNFQAIQIWWNGTFK
jgi:hypothetical protein